MFIYLTNIWNHYMPTVCPYLAELIGEDEFRMVLVRPLKSGDPNTKMRQDMKWNMVPPVAKWVIPNPETQEELESDKYLSLVENSEVAVLGGLHGSKKLFRAIDRRIAAGRLTFFTNERYFKQYVTIHDCLNPINLYRWYRQHKRFSHPNVHYLPINHFGPTDMRFYDACRGRIWKWGYFPYVSDAPTEKPAHEGLRIGWCGRFMELKHVDLILHAIAHLPAEYRIQCRLELIGEGECKDSLMFLSQKLKLNGQVSFSGYRPVAEITQWMASLDTYIFPSDIQEGWGVVLAEAMDKCCVPISCVEAGATLDLINDGENGFVFEKGDARSVAKKLAWMIDHPSERKAMGLKAWERMQQHTPKLAAERLVQLIKAIQTGDKSLIPETGICSDVSW